MFCCGTNEDVQPMPPGGEFASVSEVDYRTCEVRTEGCVASCSTRARGLTVPSSNSGKPSFRRAGTYGKAFLVFGFKSNLALRLDCVYSKLRLTQKELVGVDPLGYRRWILSIGIVVAHPE